jgi:hypothetical protein
VGSLGHVPFERQRGFRLARLDDDQRALVHDAEGRAAQGKASECEPDEPGELLLRVFPNKRDPHGAFRGYTARDASAKRIAHDVLRRARRRNDWGRPGRVGETIQAAGRPQRGARSALGMSAEQEVKS